MSYQLVESGGVIRLSDNAHLRRGQPGWAEYLEWQKTNLPSPPPQPQLSDVATSEDKLAAERAIDGIAGRVRLKYITDIPGQAESYQLKYENAKAFILAGYPAESIDNYPWVKQEALALGESAATVADEIVAQGDLWANILGPAIEGVRRKGKSQLAALTSKADIIAHVASIKAELEAL